MTVYIGIDFHPHQQTICWMDSIDGVIKYRTLDHNKDDIRAFYKQFTGQVIIGIESSGAIRWFEQMIFDIGHKLKIGDAALIRSRATSRHKSDKKDAELILDLLMRDQFPELWRRTSQSELVLEQLRFRHSLVQKRTSVANRIQFIAHSLGLAKNKTASKRMRHLLLSSAHLHPTQKDELSYLYQLFDTLSSQIKSVETWLEAQAESNPKVELLRTHHGVGLLTALAVVHTLGDVNRFATSRKVVAYIGLDPVEESSGSRVRIGSISKAGSSLVRFLLGQSAQISIKKDKELRAFYQRVSQRRGKAIAKVATARKLLVRLFTMLKQELSYTAFIRGSKVGHPV